MAADGVVDRLLDGVVKVLQNRHEPDGLWRRTVRSWRLLLLAASLAYLLALCLVLAGLTWWGERNWLLSILLFLPAQGWLLPLGVLTPVCLVCRARYCLIHLLCVFLVLVVYMDWNWHSSIPAGPNDQPLTILTNNIGQNNRQSIRPFVDAEKPDILALQDAKGRAYRYVARYPKHHVASRGEFVLISRYPIGRSGLVSIPNINAGPVAAWFEVDFHGHSIRVYNVHLPTPRTDLGRVRGLGVVKELLRPYVRGRDAAGWSYRKSLKQRIALTEGLAKKLAAETGPCIVAGDFNMPDHGYLYGRFAALLQDAFELRGRGYGYTFPGTTHNPITLFGPWLRIDYIFCAGDWQVQHCRAEPDRRSQHRAVAARLALRQP